MTLTEFLTGIRGRLAAATPGPWYLVDSLTDEESGVPGGTIAKVVAHQMLDDEEHCKTFIICEPDTCKDSDAALIASSPTDLALAVEVISVQSQAIKDALYVFAGSCAIEGQTDEELDKREASIMRLLELNDKIDALLKGSGE